MLNKIIKFSLDNKLMVLLGAILLIVGGTYSMRHLDIDVFPDLTAPTVVVMTDAHTMAAEEVERLISFPIETSVNGATGVRRVRSTSMPGISFVWVEFDWGFDIFKARQIVSEKMVTLNEDLPEGIVPELAPQSSVMGEILFIGIQADSTSSMELRTLADWVIKPTILATGGVSQVTIIGGDYKQYQIIADPVRMKAYGVSMEELKAAAQGISENSSGGIVRAYGNEYALIGQARTTQLEDLGMSYIKDVNGKSVVISDVADVQIGTALKMGYASQNGTPSIIISVSKQPNVNTLKVTENIEKNIRAVQASLPADVKIDMNIFRQADFIEASVNNVGRALLEGAIFVVLILFLFLGSFRTTLISTIAIPLSLLGTVIVLYLLGMDINTMTLGGMCIAIGSLVDDAIIDVENVYKRLQQNHRLPEAERQPKLKVIYEASVEIRASILNATFIILVVFTPLFFLSGMEGRMLKPLGIAYIISLLMSLIVAMTVTPLMCRMMLSSDRYLNRNKKESRFSAFLGRGYQKSLSWVLNHKKPVLFSTLGLLIGSIIVYATLGSSFLPNFNEGSLTISVIAKPGISLTENDELGTLVEKELLKIPEISTTARRTGRGELDAHSQATNSAEIDVNFTLQDRSQEEFLAHVRSSLAGIPGIATTVGQPLAHRIDHMLSGTKASIAIKLFGTDLSTLFLMGNQIKAHISDIEGLVDVTVDQQTETPEIHIRPNRSMLAKYGIKISEFNEFVELAFSHARISEIYEGQRKFDLILRLKDEYSMDMDGLSKAMIDTKYGKIPLSQVAEIVSVGGPNSISRENVQRKIVVSANVAGRDIKGVVDDIKTAVNENIEMPEGYRVEYGGQFESAEQASKTLLIASLLAILVVFLLLYLEFKDVVLSGIVLLNLPLALIGGVLAIRFSSGIVSIPSIIGFITLFGIATRNGILLISRYQHSRQEYEDLRNRILHGSVDRLNPILMTALTAALALIPLVLNGDKSGNEIQSPMAIVVLGGLLTSTLLNIYIIPIFYEWFMQYKHRKSNRIGKALALPLILLLAGNFSMLEAQEPVKVGNEEKVFTNYKDVLQEIESNNILLQAHQAHMEAGKLGNKTGIYPENPQIGFSNTWSNTPGEPGGMDLSVSQALDFPGVYVNQKKNTDLMNANLEETYREERRKLMLVAEECCLELVHANYLKNLWKEKAGIVEKMILAYGKLLKTGNCTSLEVNRMKMYSIEIAQRCSEIELRILQLEAQLKQLNGGHPIRLLQTEFSTPFLSDDFQTWFESHADAFPEWKKAENEVKISEGNVKLRNSQWFPKIALGYKAGNLRKEVEHEISVGISVPLWANVNTVKQAKVGLQAALKEEEDFKMSFKTRLGNLYQRVLQLQELVTAYRTAIVDFNNISILEKALEKGQISLLEYISEQDYYYEALEKYITAEFELATTYARLHSMEVQP